MKWKVYPVPRVRPWNDPLRPFGVMLAYGDGCTLFWPFHHVAMVRTEHFGRFEVISADGHLAHHPGPWEALRLPTLVDASPGVLVNPRWAEVHGSLVRVPGGWEAPLEGTLPQPEPFHEEDPEIPELGVRVSEVLYVRGESRQSTCSLVTAEGERTVPLCIGQVVDLVPGLLKAGTRYFNCRRVRELEADPSYHQRRLIHLDEGTAIPLFQPATRALLEALDLDSHRWLPLSDERQLHLVQEHLRNWPVKLRDAPEEFLREHFDEPRGS